jgi:hypothetical protein
MRYFAIHDATGNVTALAVFQSDTPPPVVVARSTDFYSEVEVPEGLIDLASPVDERRIHQLLNQLQVGPGNRGQAAGALAEESRVRASLGRRWPRGLGIPPGAVPTLSDHLTPGFLALR